MATRYEDGICMIGYVDLGTHHVPRAKLARVLPDIQRFERCLPDALVIDRYMTEHDGAIPAHILDGWSSAYRRDVIVTLRELGELTLADADELESCGSDHEPPPEAA